MLNLFPIQFLAPLTYLLLRVVLGVLFLRTGKKIFVRHPLVSLQNGAALLHILAGLSFLFGFYTQVAAMLGMLLSFAGFIPSFRTKMHSPLPRSTILLAFAISLSLFVTGAGPFAFDLPI